MYGLCVSVSGCGIYVCMSKKERSSHLGSTLSGPLVLVGAPGSSDDHLGTSLATGG